MAVVLSTVLSASRRKDHLAKAPHEVRSGFILSLCHNFIDNSRSNFIQYLSLDIITGELKDLRASVGQLQQDIEIERQKYIDLQEKFALLRQNKAEVRNYDLAANRY